MHVLHNYFITKWILSSEIHPFWKYERDRDRNGEWGGGEERDPEKEREAGREIERYKDTERQERGSCFQGSLAFCVKTSGTQLCWLDAGGLRELASRYKFGINRLEFSADMWAILNKTGELVWRWWEHLHQDVPDTWEQDLPRCLWITCRPRLPLPGAGGDIRSAACPLSRHPTLPFWHFL